MRSSGARSWSRSSSSAMTACTCRDVFDAGVLFFLLLGGFAHSMRRALPSPPAHAAMVLLPGFCFSSWASNRCSTAATFLLLGVWFSSWASVPWRQAFNGRRLWCPPAAGWQGLAAPLSTEAAANSCAAKQVTEEVSGARSRRTLPQGFTHLMVRLPARNLAPGRARSVRPVLYITSIETWVGCIGSRIEPVQRAAAKGQLQCST